MKSEPEVSVFPDDRELIGRVQRDGDMDAFDVLYRRHVEGIHGFVFKRSGSRTVAEDVTQATFEKALRSIGSFRWRGGGFAAWLYRIASNELVTHFRREGRARDPKTLGAMRALSPEQTPHDAIEDGVLTSVETEALRRALDRVSPRYQRALALRYLSGLTLAETAAAMGTTKAVLSVTLYRAVGALRRELERAEGSAEGGAA